MSNREVNDYCLRVLNKAIPDGLKDQQMLRWLQLNDKTPERDFIRLIVNSDQSCAVFAQFSHLVKPADRLSIAQAVNDEMIQTFGRNTVLDSSPAGAVAWSSLEIVLKYEEAVREVERIFPRSIPFAEDLAANSLLRMSEFSFNADQKLQTIARTHFSDAKSLLALIPNHNDEKVQWWLANLVSGQIFDPPLSETRLAEWKWIVPLLTDGLSVAPELLLMPVIHLLEHNERNPVKKVDHYELNADLLDQWALDPAVQRKWFAAMTSAADTMAAAGRPVNRKYDDLLAAVRTQAADESR